MIPLKQKPLIVSIIKSQKLFFTYLSFMEQYLRITLLEPNPLLLQYSQENRQTIIANQHAIQVYETDWKYKVSLKCFVPLYEQKVQFIVWNKKWYLFGNFAQYSNLNMKFITISQLQQQQKRYYFSNKCVTLTPQRFILQILPFQWQYDIIWHQKQQWMLQLDQSQQISLSAIELDDNTILVSISNLCILIRQKVVIKQFINKGKCHINKKFVIWQFNTIEIMAYYIIDDELKLAAQFLFDQGHQYLASDCLQQKKSQIGWVFMIYSQKEKEVRLYNYNEKDDKGIKNDINSQKKGFQSIFNISSILKKSQQSHQCFNQTSSLKQSQEQLNNLKIALKGCINSLKSSLNQSFIVSSAKNSDKDVEEANNQQQRLLQLQYDNQDQDEQKISQQQKCQQSYNSNWEQAQSGCQWQALQNKATQPYII